MGRLRVQILLLVTIDTLGLLPSRASVHSPLLQAIYYYFYTRDYIELNN